MLRCKQVSKALADKKYWELPLHQRIGLRLHVGLCVICGPFNRFVMLMQDAVRHYLQHEQSNPPPENMRLPPESKERMKANLHKVEREEEAQ